jgi:hypothetical protein
MHDDNLQEQKSHTNKNSIQNANIFSKPKFHFPSNGALVFGVSLILCTGKWRQPFTETVPAFDSAHKTQLTGRQSAPFERA